MSYLFFATDWMPNGTNDLLVVDPEDGFNVVDCIPEALFGVNVSASKEICFNGEFITALENEKELENEFYLQVKEIPAIDLCHHIACSPCDPTGLSVIDKLRPYLITKA